MFQQLFSNNAEVTLSSAISSSTTSIALSTEDLAKLPTPVTNVSNFYLTITDGTNMEIVKVASKSASDLTVVRGQEGTTGTAFDAGTSAFVGITAGYLSSVPMVDRANISLLNTAIDLQTGRSSTDNYAKSSYSYAIGYNNIANGTGACSIGRNMASFGTGAFSIGDSCVSYGASYLQTTYPTWQPSTAYAKGDIVVSPANASKFWMCASAGTSLGSAPAEVSSEHNTIKDNNIIWKVLSYFSGTSMTFGNSAKAFGGASFNSGQTNIAAQNSVSFNGNVYGSDSFGFETNIFPYTSFSFRKPVYTISRSFNTASLPTYEKYYEWDGEYAPLYSPAISGMAGTIPFDLSGGPTWQASTQYHHGSIISPTTPNGAQYIRGCGAVDYWSDPARLGYIPASSGTVEPTWTANQDDWFNDGNGDWQCIPYSTGMLFSVHNDTTIKMVIEELSFVCSKAANVSTAPVISMGTDMLNLTNILNNQTASGLTGEGSVHIFRLDKPILTNTFTIQVNQVATADMMYGSFMVKGYYYRDDSNFF